MKLVISYEDVKDVVEKFKIISKKRNKVLDGDGFEYLLQQLFIKRGFWIEEGNN